MTTKIWSYVVLCLVLIACVVSNLQPEDVDERIDLSPIKPTAAVGIDFASTKIAERGHAIILIRLLYLPSEVGKAQWIGVIRIPPVFIVERDITVHTSYQEEPYALPFKTLAEGIETSVKSEWGLQKVGLSTEEVAKDQEDGFKFLQIEIPVVKIQASDTIEHWLSIDIVSLGHDEVTRQFYPDSTELKIMTKLEMNKGGECWWDSFCRLW